MTPTPGIYPNMPMAQYHALDAASNSRLTLLQRSPAHLKVALAEAEEDTKAMLVGRAVHTAILEPDLFDMTFAIAQQCEQTTGKGSQCSNAGIVFTAARGWLCGLKGHGYGLTSDEGRTVLSPNDYVAALGARDSVHVHTSAHQLLEGVGDVELSLVWTDKESGVRCKGRLDRHAPQLVGGTIVDVKKTKDAREGPFSRAVFGYGYHRQGEFYLQGARENKLPAEHFVIIAVEPDPPYAVACYRIIEDALKAGRDQLLNLLARYNACKASNHWPAYADEVRDISLPDYSWRQIEQELMEAVA